MTMMAFPRVGQFRRKPDPPYVPPTWHAAVSAGTWGTIPGTASPPGGLNMDAYCDFAVRQADAAIMVAAAGGHSDGNSNAAAALALNTNTPGWQLLKASSHNGTDIDVPYYSDGTPCSRHTYHHTHYIAATHLANAHDAILLAGGRYGWGGGTPGSQGMDLFAMGATNAYLPRYTWPDVQNAGHFGVIQDSAGNVWTQTGYKFSMSTKAWTKPGSGSMLRYPVAHDSVLNLFFALQFGDGEGFDPHLGVRAVEFDPATGNSRTITFNASAALTQYISDTPAYAAMAYNPHDGKYYFLHPGRMGTFYVVTPNASTVWDMSLYTPSGTTPICSGALCGRLKYVSLLRMFVMQGAAAQNLTFLKLV